MTVYAGLWLQQQVHTWHIFIDEARHCEQRASGIQEVLQKNHCGTQPPCAYYCAAQEYHAAYHTVHLCWLLISTDRDAHRAYQVQERDQGNPGLAIGQPGPVQHKGCFLRIGHINDPSEIFKTVSATCAGIHVSCMSHRPINKECVAMWIIVTFNCTPGVAFVRYETLLPGIQDIIVAVGNGAMGRDI